MKTVKKTYAKRALAALLIMATVFTVGCGSGNIGKYDPPEREGYKISGGEYVADAALDVPDELLKMNIKAVGTESKLISSDASFTVKTAEKTTAEVLSANLTITPYTAFSVAAVSETEFTVTPTEKLDEGKIYRFTVGDAENPVMSFVFQTETGMGIKSTIPADLAVGVVLNTGIEITFTDTVEGVNFPEYISVSPAATGEFMLYPDGKTVVFIPTDKLSADTVYEVTVKKGIRGGSGMETDEDETFRFRTGNSVETGYNNEISINAGAGELVFSPDEFPTVSYSVTNLGGLSFDAHDVEVRLYKYKNAESAKKALFEYEKAKYGSGGETDGKYEFPASGLTKTAELTIEPAAENTNNYSAQLYFSLPKTEEGIYLMEYVIPVSWNGKEYEESYQCIMSVTDLRLYTESAGGETLFWVTDPDGEPVPDAEITVSAFERNAHWNTEFSKNESAETVKTDKDGIAIAKTDGKNAAYVTASDGDDELISFVSLSDTVGGDYFAGYVYTDREVYFADDKVNYSGVITPEGGAVMPTKLYVYIGASPYGTVNVDDGGGFVGSIPVEGYAGWGFNVRFCDADGNIVISKYIRVTQEDKPVYKASISYDRVFYEYGDTGEMTVTATFYDGTPAPGLRFYVYGNDYSQYGSGEVVTDSEGKATVKFKPSVRGCGDVYSTYPVNVYFRAELIGYETTLLVSSASVPFFHSEYQLRTERVSGDETEVRLYKTDTSRIKSASDITPDSILGKPADGEISVSLIKYTFYKVKSGTSYDPITKTTTENYYYDRKESTEESYTAKFENGVVKLPHIAVKDGEEASYFYKISFKDKKNSLTYNLSLWAVKNGKRESDWYYEGHRLYTDKDLYGVGESVELTLEKGERKVENPVLYGIYTADGRILGAVSDGEFAFEFTDDMVLGCRVYAVTYDGGFVYRSAVPAYNYEESGINVEIIPDSDTYKPGDSANVKIRLTDAEGKPISGRVTLGVVDEACFSLGEQTLMPAADYFNSVGRVVYPNVNGRFYPFAEMEGNVYCGDISCVYCARDMVTEETAEADAPADSDMNYSETGKGGEEEIDVRDYFSDNPVFNVVTAKNGEAVVSFTVPDNITEWRLTAVATKTDSSVTSERLLGAGVTDVICTLPYFINVSACELYIIGDDVAMSVRSYGKSVQKNTKVKYRAVLYRDGEIVSENKTEASGNGFGWINFGKLDGGAYSVIVEGRSDVGNDAVEVKFSVAESAVIVDVDRELTASELKDIKPITYPITLSFYNGELELYRRALDKIRYSYVPNRADSVAAYYTAETASEILYGSNGAAGGAEKIAGDYGLVPLLDYGTESLVLSAKILAIAPESISIDRKASIVEILKDQVRSSEFVDEEELTATLLGLASQNEPILDVLYYVAGGCKEYSLTAKLYLAAAFAYVGDFSAASEIYADLADECRREGEGGEISFEGKNTEETIRNTANALITASRISRRDAEGMVRYLLTHTSDSEYYGLELASYVKFYMPTEMKTSEFSYSFEDGVVENVELKAGRTYTLTLTKTGFDSLSIIDCDEDIKVTARYGGTPADATIDGEVSGEFTIERVIEPYDTELGLYVVTLNFSGKSDRNYERLEISDTIPTGARFVSMMRGSSSSEISVSGGKRGYAYIRNDSGQKMEGGISIYTPYAGKIYNWNSTCSEYTYTGSVSYVIRGAVRGEFIAESPMMRNPRTGAYALGSRVSVVIDDGEWKTTTLK